MIDSGPLLSQAAPYIERFRGHYVVVKVGGELLGDVAIVQRIVDQLDILYRCGLKPVLVHGGGKQIDIRCEEAGVTIEKQGGRRITSPEVRDIVVDVVAGELNRRFCDRLKDKKLPVRGFREGASEAIQCQRRPPRTLDDGETIDFGEVGDVVSIDVETVFGGDPSSQFAIPVLPSIGKGEDGQWLNVNADSVAAKVAIALSAQKLIMLSRAPGVMNDVSDAGPIAQLSPSQVKELLGGPRVVAGMKAKLEEALRAHAAGVPQIHIVSGAAPFTLLREIFTDDGCGTLIHD